MSKNRRGLRPRPARDPRASSRSARRMGVRLVPPERRAAGNAAAPRPPRASPDGPRAAALLRPNSGGDTRPSGQRIRNDRRTEMVRPLPSVGTFRRGSAASPQPIWRGPASSGHDRPDGARREGVAAAGRSRVRWLGAKPRRHGCQESCVVRVNPSSATVFREKTRRSSSNGNSYSERSTKSSAPLRYVSANSLMSYASRKKR